MFEMLRHLKSCRMTSLFLWCSTWSPLQMLINPMNLLHCVEGPGGVQGRSWLRWGSMISNSDNQHIGSGPHDTLLRTQLSYQRLLAMVITHRHWLQLCLHLMRTATSELSLLLGFVWQTDSIKGPLYTSLCFTLFFVILLDSHQRHNFNKSVSPHQLLCVMMF